jgi:prophage regulatory protein
MNLNQYIEGDLARISRPNEVRNRLGVSRAKFADMVAKGHFPKPFTIIPGGRAVGWLESDVNAWIMQRSSTVSEALS